MHAVVKDGSKVLLTLVVNLLMKKCAFKMTVFVQQSGLRCVGLHPLVCPLVAEPGSLCKMVCSFRATAADARQ